MHEGAAACACAQAAMRCASKPVGVTRTSKRSPWARVIDITNSLTCQTDVVSYVARACGNGARLVKLSS